MNRRDFGIAGSEPDAYYQSLRARTTRIMSTEEHGIDRVTIGDLTPSQREVVAGILVQQNIASVDEGRTLRVLATASRRVARIAEEVSQIVQPTADETRALERRAMRRRLLITAVALFFVIPMVAALF